MYKKCAVYLLAILFILPVLSSCSKTPVLKTETTQQDTSLQDTSSSDMTQDLSETTASTDTTPVSDVTSYPTSTAVVSARPVDGSGHLQVIGTNLCNEKGEPVQLKGMSLHGLQAVGDFITKAGFRLLQKIGAVR